MYTKPPKIPKELEERIVVESVKSRRCFKVKPNESGWCRFQTFTIKDFPEKIPFKYIGMVKCADGIARPKYKSEVVSNRTLRLYGRRGLKNGCDIMNKICSTCFQEIEGIYMAESIKRTDLKKSEGNEKLSYWLASTVGDAILGIVNIKPEIVICGSVPGSENSLIFPYSLRDVTDLAIRPTIILDIGIDVKHQYEVEWVSL